ncbi:hypothetical protein B0H10DRAFT_2080947 [Mycena sp. CBHHK59/15]|nr:hypothetical protein B0H10DRAFT_2080947 [Mycena sp. CBHHK59/15]
MGATNPSIIDKHGHSDRLPKFSGALSFLLWDICITVNLMWPYVASVASAELRNIKLPRRKPWTHMKFLYLFIRYIPCLNFVDRFARVDTTLPFFAP